MIGPPYPYWLIRQRHLQVGFKELALPAVAVLKGQVHPVPVVWVHADRRGEEKTKVVSRWPGKLWKVFLLPWFKQGYAVSHGYPPLKTWYTFIGAVLFQSE